MEKELEKFQNKETMYKVIEEDLSEFKKRAEMSKELATFFSPFTPIQTFKLEELTS